MNIQRGFSLIESVVSLAIVVTVATGAGSAAYYTYKANNKSGTVFPAVNSIQIAGSWISRDIQIANRTSLVDGALPVDPAITPVDFFRTDYYSDPPVSNTITYTLTGGELTRNFDGQNTTVARDISSVSFSMTGRFVTMNISSVGQSKTYQVHLRPSWN